MGAYINTYCTRTMTAYLSYQQIYCSLRLALAYREFLKLEHRFLRDRVIRSQ